MVNVLFVLMAVFSFSPVRYIGCMLWFDDEVSRVAACTTRTVAPPTIRLLCQCVMHVYSIHMRLRWESMTFPGQWRI